MLEVADLLDADFRLATKDWQQVKDDVHVKLLNRGGELYVLARSLPRRSKESAMRRKKLKAYWGRASKNFKSATGIR